MLSPSKSWLAPDAVHRRVQGYRRGEILSLASKRRAAQHLVDEGFSQRKAFLGSFGLSTAG